MQAMDKEIERKLGKVVENKKGRKKLKFIWSCSDFVKHEHKFYFTAWLCGKLQYFRGVLNEKNRISKVK